MRFKVLFFCGIISLFCFSCSYKQQHVLFEQKTTPLADTTHSSIAPYAYKIKADDRIQIRNLQNYKAFSNESGNSSSQIVQTEVFQVEEDGKVALPIIGHIPVAGLTRYEAAKKIESLYADSSLKNPIIELKILDLHVKAFGEIKSQGVFPLNKEKTTLMDVLGLAGGLTNNADEKNIKIIRDNNPKPIYIDLGDIRTLTDPRIILHDGDIIYIAQNRRAIRDEKLQNFSTLVQPSLLIFNTALIIYTLFKK